ncbi:PLP-dependent aminotransferase family protein [Franconibacter pulveris]|uniref:aminotransferase-like domain-containing protein n=1 Tax=Franconibacter pulveris TaxID=435910 RepID=UPI000496DB95|nr:PLP-dependent aminotransferase family protein [Franconibacter pulveris]HBI11095.1 PLP-dependent aminotransferase family protein [Franconibacter pulveris]
MTRYQHLADLLTQRIRQGLYQQGERLPSVRSLSQEHGVSISTVQQAYSLLEERRLVLPQPRSGYFVAPQKAEPPAPRLTRPEQRPVEISQWNETLALLEARKDKAVFPFGGGSPDISHPTLKPLWREISRVASPQRVEAMFGYDELAGNRELREQIARLMLDGGAQVNSEEIIVTPGCHGALSLAVSALCQPGDIVAMESPSYYGTMQMLRGLGLKVIEIPTDSQTGISVEALELALEQWPIKAVLLVPTCNNPLGFTMPLARKRAVLNLAARFDIALIEDDIYGETAWQYPRPATIKSMDEEGRVLLCSSFSKTVAPGLRVGWIAPGRYYDRVLHRKYIATTSSPPATQTAIAAFIREGHYHRHLRRIRQHYQRNYDVLSCKVRSLFPCGICVSRPQGGFMMWVELPEEIDLTRYTAQMQQRRLHLAAGHLFSASEKYRNCLRLNFAAPFDEKSENALRNMGEFFHEVMRKG